jgi:hypothetical protein
MYVSNVSYRCCKSRSRRCICCNGCTHILQVFLSICFICFTHMLKVFYLDIAYVCNGFQVFLCVFSSVLDVCFKYFICLLLYVASVVSRCFKSRSGIVHRIRVGSERGASRPCTRSGNVTDVRGGTNDIWDGTSLLLRLSLRGDLLRNPKLKWVSNTIPISYDRILIWKTYFRY